MRATLGARTDSVKPFWQQETVWPDKCNKCFARKLRLKDMRPAALQLNLEQTKSHPELRDFATEQKQA